MACIERVPNCGSGTGPNSVATPLAQLGAILGIFGLIIGGLSAAGSLPEIAAAISGFLGAGGAGAVGGLVVALAAITLIGMYWYQRCTGGDEPQRCIAGCVSNIENEFSSTTDYLLPFTAMHPRVDVTVKSFFWDFVELNDAFVYCTNEPYPRQSEVMHCYYKSGRVCAAEAGSFIGGVAGGVGGVIAAAAIVTAIGCATVILCFLAFLLAAIVVLACVLGGAFIGGNVAAAIADEGIPTDSAGNVIATGNLVTLTGNTQNLSADNNANILWWVTLTQPHGDILPGTQQPYSYCDIDEQLMMDACPRATPPIG